MSNPFYNYSGNFVANTSARAEAVAAEFSSVAAAFALMVDQGVESGSVNAYVVTTQGAPTVAYTDGLTTSFKATHANTGAATLNVNGLGAVGLLRYGGAASSANDILANVWYTVVYNSAYSGFTITSPTPTAVIQGTISSLPPPNKVGLTAQPGFSTSAAPIDACPAIDQTINPIWTGTHRFSGTARDVEIWNSNPLTFLSGAGTGTQHQLACGTGGWMFQDITDSVTYMQGTTSSLSFYVSGVSVTIFANGGVTIGTPTGGNKGAGTLNVAGGLYVNGTAVTVP